MPLLGLAWIVLCRTQITLFFSSIGPLRVTNFTFQLSAQLASVARGDSAPDYVLHLVLRGRFPSNVAKSQNFYGAAPPPFLEDAVLRRAQQQAAQVPVRYHEGPIQVVAAKEATARGRGFDVLDISNILDLMKDNQMREDVGRVLASSLAPGGMPCPFSLLLAWEYYTYFRIIRLLP